MIVITREIDMVIDSLLDVYMSKGQRGLNLHGMDSKAARLAVEREVGRMWGMGGGILEIIYGRGTHSMSPPVLRTQLIEFLASSNEKVDYIVHPDYSRNPGATTVYISIREPNQLQRNKLDKIKKKLAEIHSR